MDTRETEIPSRIQAVLDRFITACQDDDRILAAFLLGSYARDAADQHSDLDLYVITTDKDFDDFYTQRDAFMKQLGEPIFMEDFDIPNIAFYILSNGVEVEFRFGQVSQFDDIRSEPYKLLVDKKDILSGVVFPDPIFDSVEQTEKLRRQIYWFWHDMSHFITAIGRGQLWWAQGQLEELRRYCIRLVRLRNNFTDSDTMDEVYFKLEKVMPVEQLSNLVETFCPMETHALLLSSLRLVQFYKELAVPLARAHGINYPDALERNMVQRLENLHQSI